MNEKFERVNLINLDVFITRIDSIDNKKLLEEIESSSLEIQNRESNSILDSGSITYHASYEDRKLDKTLPECSMLSIKIEDVVSSIVGKKMLITEIWSLTLSAGESVFPHSHKSNTHMHPMDYYSVAYYPNAPAGGSKLFFEASWCGTMENLISISPESGMLVIFNSYIRHMTDRHRVSENRVVVSANLSPEYPNTAPVPDWSAYN